MVFEARGSSMSGLLVPMLAQVITFNAGDRSGVRARLSEQTLSYDAETVPEAELSVSTRRAAYTLGYSLSLSALSIGDPEYQTVLFHSGELSASFRFRRAFVRLEQSAGYGEANFKLTPLGLPSADLPAADEPPDPANPADPADPAAPEPPPASPESAPDQERAVDTVVRYATTSSSASVTHVLSRRWSFTESLGYSVETGLDEASRTVYPQQRTLDGGIVLGHTLSRVDNLFSGLRTSSVETTTIGTSALITSAREAWLHRFNRKMSGGFAAGAAYWIAKDRAGNESSSVSPIADAYLNHELRRQGTRHRITLTASVSPSVDRTTGFVDDRVLWSASLTSERGRLTLLASTTGARSLDTGADSSLTSLSAAVGGIYSITEQLKADASLSTLWQLFGPTAEVVAPVWALSLGLTYRIAPLSL